MITCLSYCYRSTAGLENDTWTAELDEKGNLKTVTVSHGKKVVKSLQVQSSTKSTIKLSGPPNDEIELQVLDREGSQITAAIVTGRAKSGAPRTSNRFTIELKKPKAASKTQTVIQSPKAKSSGKRKKA